MLVYVDASILARAYLPDEHGHAAATAVLDDTSLARITSTLTRLEVTAALTRRAKTSPLDLDAALQVLASDLGPGGCVTELVVDQRQIETKALELVAAHALRTLDALHLAAAALLLRAVSSKGQPIGLASTDIERRRAAEQLGLAVLP